jgi:hypothetical protein
MIGGVAQPAGACLVLGLVVVAHIDLKEAARLGTAASKVRKSREPQGRRAAVGPACEVREGLVRQFRGKRSDLQVPYFDTGLCPHAGGQQEGRGRRREEGKGAPFAAGAPLR